MQKAEGKKQISVSPNAALLVQTMKNGVKPPREWWVHSPDSGTSAVMCPSGEGEWLRVCLQGHPLLNLQFYFHSIQKKPQTQPKMCIAPLQMLWHFQPRFPWLLNLEAALETSRLCISLLWCCCEIPCELTRTDLLYGEKCPAQSPWWLQTFPGADHPTWRNTRGKITYPWICLFFSLLAREELSWRAWPWWMRTGGHQLGGMRCCLRHSGVSLEAFEWPWWGLCFWGRKEVREGTLGCLLCGALW